jgi:hypothetical protein
MHLQMEHRAGLHLAVVKREPNEVDGGMGMPTLQTLVTGYSMFLQW